MPDSIASLRRKRQALVQRLPPLARRVVRGSLIERYLPCGKPGCHGPKYYLSVSYPKGRPQLQYLSQPQHAQVQTALRNFQHVRDLLEQICDINRQLLRRQEKV